MLKVRKHIGKLKRCFILTCLCKCCICRHSIVHHLSLCFKDVSGYLTPQTQVGVMAHQTDLKKKEERVDLFLLILLQYF